MGRHLSRKKFVRVSTVAVLLLAATSTGTILASDPCKVILVQKFTDVADKAERHLGTRHKHTKSTLAAWKAWGDAYLAEHGHPYVPPKRTFARTQPKTPRERDAMFKFACESFEIPTISDELTTELEPLEVPPFEPAVPIYLASNTPPEQPLAPLPPNTPPNTPSVPLIPIYPPGFPSSPGVPPLTPPVITPINPEQPPAANVPEPASFVLVGTGLAAFAGLRSKRRASRSL